MDILASLPHIEINPLNTEAFWASTQAERIAALELSVEAAKDRHETLFELLEEKIDNRKGLYSVFMAIVARVKRKEATEEEALFAKDLGRRMRVMFQEETYLHDQLERLYYLTISLTQALERQHNNENY